MSVTVPAIGAAVLGGGVALFWVWTSLVFLRRARPARVHRAGRVALILPLAGAPSGLPALLRALAAQSLPPARLIVATEEGDGAAAAAARAVPLPFPVEVVTAPRAAHRGQKCSNLLAGLARLAPEDRVAVLLDADIRPQPWWLSTLASPAIEGTADLVSGYRWLRPGRSPVSQLVALHDRAFAVLPRADWMPVAWGGSLALGPAALAGGAAGAALERTLSDDLSLARMAARRGLRLLIRRILLLPTPLDGTAAAQLRFLVRQHRIVHLHVPVLWWMGAATGHLGLGLWVALAALMPAALLFPAGCGALRWAVNDRIGRRVGAPDPPGTRAAQLLLSVTPLPDLLNVALAWASLFPGQITWRHVTYRVSGPDSVRVLRRAAP